MSFSTEIKNEVCSLKLSRVENISFLSGFVRNNKLEDVNKISLVTENPKIIRYLYNLFKEIYGVSPLIEKGKSNNFNKNTYYNLVIDNNANFILKDIMVIDENNKILDKPKSYITDTEDLKAISSDCYALPDSPDYPDNHRESISQDAPVFSVTVVPGLW